MDKKMYICYFSHGRESIIVIKLKYLSIPLSNKDEPLVDQFGFSDQLWLHKPNEKQQ